MTQFIGHHLWNAGVPLVLHGLQGQESWELGPIALLLLKSVVLCPVGSKGSVRQKQLPKQWRPIRGQ